MRRQQRAFTLVELLVAMALSILVGGILYLLQSTGLSQVTKGTIQLTMQSEVRRKVERMVSDLRCANEVLEISPDSIKISQLKNTSDGDDPGTIVHYTVTYSLERIGNRSHFFRKQDNEDPVDLFTVDHIDSEVFFPYYQVRPAPKEDLPFFHLFDMRENDSGKRRNICFIRIRLKTRQNKEYMVLATAATLRPAQHRLLQPAWKSR
jgi:prepilin-type N-terminal cleavage/methylation domain-containing protein